VEESGCVLIRGCYSDALHRGNEKSTKTSVRVMLVPADVRTGHLKKVSNVINLANAPDKQTLDTTDEVVSN
jgi:hypothetical protein